MSVRCPPLGLPASSKGPPVAYQLGLRPFPLVLMVLSAGSLALSTGSMANSAGFEALSAGSEALTADHVTILQHLFVFSF